jgi:predicted acyl esterase
MDAVALAQVREIENVWIPMSDGCRIAARVWVPASAS